MDIKRLCNKTNVRQFWMSYMSKMQIDLDCQINIMCHEHPSSCIGLCVEVSELYRKKCMCSRVQEIQHCEAQY